MSVFFGAVSKKYLDPISLSDLGQIPFLEIAIVKSKFRAKKSSGIFFSKAPSEKLGTGVSRETVHGAMGLTNAFSIRPKNKICIFFGD